MDAVSLIKELANWVGWAPISLGLLSFMVWGRFLYDQRINSLKDELENGKAYQYDVIYERLTKKLKYLYQERDLLESETTVQQGEIERVNKDLETAYSEIRELQNKIKQYDLQLDELLYDEPDYCMVCDVDDEHIMMNVIGWGYSREGLIGDSALVEKYGECAYCGATNIKCRVCGAITGINDHIRHAVECEGQCGNLYRLIPEVVENFTLYKVEVSRAPF